MHYEGSYCARKGNNNGNANGPKLVITIPFRTGNETEFADIQLFVKSQCNAGGRNREESGPSDIPESGELYLV